MKIRLIKALGGLLPFDPDSEAWYQKQKSGAVSEHESTVMRNPGFFRKYFALLNVGFDNWNPGEIDTKYGIPIKNFDRFRKDVAIQCGFYDMVIRLDNTAKPEAKSIAWANMEEPEFQDLYSKTIDLFLRKIYNKSDMDSEGLNRTVEQYLNFT